MEVEQAVASGPATLSSEGRDSVFLGGSRAGRAPQGRMLEATVSVRLGLGPSGFPNTVAAGAQVESGHTLPVISCGTPSKSLVLLATQFSHV